MLRKPRRPRRFCPGLPQRPVRRRHELWVGNDGLQAPDFSTVFLNDLDLVPIPLVIEYPENWVKV